MNFYKLKTSTPGTINGKATGGMSKRLFFVYLHNGQKVIGC